jgi:hypothetical protein
MYTLWIHAQTCGGRPAFSLRGELAPARLLQDLVFALVALLVALVHHRGSHPVTLGNRTGMFQSPRQMRGFLRWMVTEQD